MGKIFHVLFFVIVFLAAAYSLPTNETRSTTAKKRGLSLGNVANVFTGRQTSVAVTDSIYSYLKNKIFSYGTIKIVVWNKSPVHEISNAKWKAINAEIEAPLVRAIESEKEPAVIVAHFSRHIFKDAERIPTVWISYGSPAIGRICIYAKIQLSSGYLRSAQLFEYNVYLSPVDNMCDSPQQLFTENKENGYETIATDRFTAECALASYDMDYVLNVYIMRYPLDQANQINPVPVETAEQGTQTNPEHQSIQVQPRRKNKNRPPGI